MHLLITESIVTAPKLVSAIARFPVISSGTRSDQRGQPRQQFGAGTQVQHEFLSPRSTGQVTSGGAGASDPGLNDSLAPVCPDRKKFPGQAPSCGQSRVLESRSPGLHTFFGHIHENHGQKQVGNCLHVNASNCTGSHNSLNLPVVPDL